MNLDDLKKPWNAEVSQRSGMPFSETLRSTIANVRRDAQMRDFWMIAPLAVLAGGAVFFNWWTRDVVSVQSRIGVISIVTLAALVTVVLLYARRRSSYDDLTLKARLEREVDFLGRQVSVLLNVGYWFLLPMFLLGVVSSLMGHYERTGSYVPGLAFWRLHAVSLVVCLMAFWLCRREAQRKLAPLASHLKQLHRDLVSRSAGDSNGPHARI
ncbi:MAG TPA: hypothetical protein VGM84_06835 [Steroidobacteraceae bacterium]|jgi:hypothetical protein